MKVIIGQLAKQADALPTGFSPGGQQGMVDFRKQVAGRPFILAEFQAADLLPFDPSFLEGCLDVLPIFTGWVQAVYTDVEKGFEPGQELQMQGRYLGQPEEMDA